LPGVQSSKTIAPSNQNRCDEIRSTLVQLDENYCPAPFSGPVEQDLERSFRSHFCLTGSESQDCDLVNTTETLASTSPSAVSAVPCLAEQMFDYRRFNKMAASGSDCISMVTATMQSNSMALAGLASV